MSWVVDNLDLSYRDIQQRYNNTYIKVKDLRSDEEPFLIYVVEAREQSLIYNRINSDVDVAGLELDHRINYKDVRLVQEFPLTGVFQSGNYAYVLKRLPDRQWSRGLSNRNSVMLSHNGISVIMRHKMAYDAFHRTFYDADEAIELIKKNKLNQVALSRDFWLVSLNKKRIIAYYNQRPLGELFDKTLFCFDACESLANIFATRYNVTLN